MRSIRFRVRLNKGGHGIALDKLEKFVAASRRFLIQASEDIGIIEPNLWLGVDFQNSSTAWTSETLIPVPLERVSRFNQSVIALARSEYPAFLQITTSDQFFELTSVLDPYEVAEIAVFDEDIKPFWMEISRNTALLARQQNLLPFREEQGSVQGTIHALYKEAKEPYFNLRELSTWKLVKCVYKPAEYDSIVKALEIREQVVHVRGAVITDTRQHAIDHVTVSEIVLADPYGFADVEKFLGVHWSK